MGRSPQCQWQRSKHLLTSACFAIPWNSTSTKQLRTNSNFEVHLSSSSPFVPNTTFHHLLQVRFWPCRGPHVFPWCYVAVGTARQSLGRRVLEDVPSEALRRTMKRVKTQALMMLLDDFITSELFQKRECGELFFFFFKAVIPQNCWFLEPHSSDGLINVTVDFLRMMLRTWRLKKLSFLCVSLRDESVGGNCLGLPDHEV